MFSVAVYENQLEQNGHSPCHADSGGGTSSLDCLSLIVESISKPQPQALVSTEFPAKALLES